MERKKTGKYFKYAIGEIVLVVIGILIALSLNNWNETRKQDADFDKLIDALENEIIENIYEANYEIDNARKVQSQGSKILFNEISREELIEDRSLRQLIDVNRLDINSDDVRSLVNRQENFSKRYKVLIPHLKNYLKIEERYSKMEIDYGVQATGYFDYIVKNQPWFAYSYNNVLDSIALHKQVDFYLENPIYKNYLTSSLDGYRFAAREMIGVRSACLVILAEIKRIREGLGGEAIQKLFSQYNIKPYPEHSCDDAGTASDEFYEPGTYLPLFNSSDHAQTIQWLDDANNVVQEIELNPGELTINPASKRMKANALIELRFNGECTMKYQAEINGYLFIQ
jgi:hypothetical protein